MDHRLPFSFIDSDAERAFLIGVYSSSHQRARQQTSLEELSFLAKTAGAVVVGSTLHELRDCSPAAFLGRGKVERLRETLFSHRANLVVFDEDLKPTQNRNLEQSLGVKVMDRTGLILDIFARRARSREGKLQVELAQLEYLLPRLVGQGSELSQLAGGIGTRGPGETRLEMDRRKAKVRVTQLKRELEGVRAHRERHRVRRFERPISLVSLVGYTNAGKSTLMNRLTDASVFVEDQLFATLDPTVRRLRLSAGREILLSDTVGFVRKLPHQLVESFRSTFEEVASSDLLIHVVDASHPDVEEQTATVEKVLTDLKLEGKPCLRVLNKSDCLQETVVARKGDVLISALRGNGIETLLSRIDEELMAHYRYASLKLPHQAGAILSLLYRTGRVLRREDKEEGIQLDVALPEKYWNQFRAFQV